MLIGMCAVGADPSWSIVSNCIFFSQQLSVQKRSNLIRCVCVRTYMRFSSRLLPGDRCLGAVAVKTTGGKFCILTPGEPDNVVLIAPLQQSLASLSLFC